MASPTCIPSHLHLFYLDLLFASLKASVLMEDGLGKALILMPDAECIKRMHPLLSGDGWSHTSLEPPRL